MRISDWSSDVCSSDLWSEPLLPVKLNAAVESNESLFDLPVPAPHHRAALQAALDAGEPPLPSLEQVENMLGKLAIALPKAKIDDAEADARLEIYWSDRKSTRLTSSH